MCRIGAWLSRRTFKVGLIVALFFVAWIAEPVYVVHALRNPKDKNDVYNPKNVYEKFAKTGINDTGYSLGDNPTCNDGRNGATGHIGSIWVTDSDSDNRKFGFRDVSGLNLINFKYGQTSRDVYLRGSIYACGINTGTSSDATRLSSDKYLTIPPNSSLARGNPGGADRFSDPGQALKVRLTVGFDELKNTPGAEVNIVLEVYRCYGYFEGYHPERCGTSNIPITVRREYPLWSTSGETWISKDDRYTSGGLAGRTINGVQATSNATGKNALQNIRPTQRVYWDHYVYNDGPDAMIEKSYTAVNIDHADFLLDDDGSYTGSPMVFFSNPSGIHAWGRAPDKDKGETRVTIFDNLYNKQNVDFTVTQDQVGRRICQRLSWFWKGTKEIKNDKGEITDTDRVRAWTPYACATVPYHYPNCPGGVGSDNCDKNPPKNCDFNGTCPNDKNHQAQYAVTPTITAPSEAHLGDNVNISYAITNKSKFTKSKPLTYKTYTFILKSGESISNGDLTAAYQKTGSDGFEGVRVCQGGSKYTPNDHHRNVHSYSIRDGVPCVDTNDTNLVLDPNGGEKSWSTIVSLNNSYLNVQPGDKLCSFVAVDKWNVVNGEEANSIAASTVACTLIIKSPSLQLTGSDAKAGGNFTGSSYSVANTITGNENRGSYSQLANISNGNISKFGSNNHTTILDKGGVSNLSCKLDFANVTGLTGRCNSSNVYALGRFSSGATGSSSLPTKPSSTKTLSGNVGVGGLTGTAAYSVSGNANIHGTLKTDTHATIYVSGNVTIGSNINYADTTFGQTVSTKSAVNRIPSLTIVSENGNITVNDGVTVVNANLVAAKGRVITCAGGNSNSNLGIIGSCNKKLQINGGIVSKGSPKFLRTFGNGNDGSSYYQWYNNAMSASSEWINYTPNVWLTPYTNSHSMSGITDFKTTQIDELPARL